MLIYIFMVTLTSPTSSLSPSTPPHAAPLAYMLPRTPLTHLPPPTPLPPPAAYFAYTLPPPTTTHVVTAVYTPTLNMPTAEPADIAILLLLSHS